MKKTLIKVLAMGVLGLTMTAGNAMATAFVNGSFETGDTTGWVTNSYGLNPFGTTYGSGMDGKYWAWVAGYEHPYYFEQTLTGLTTGADL